MLNHTDLSRTTGRSGEINLETINWGNYDLVVIDESHNFRNNPPRQDRPTRYSRLMRDIIRSGVRTKVLMLSATPVNSRMNDLKNQVAFITEGKDDALFSTGIPSIEHADTMVSEFAVKRGPPSHLTIVTLHSAKGLEFPIVIMPMLDDGVFPRFSIDSGTAEWREQRRLFYVGVTRAMNDLHVLYSKQHGMSPFLKDLVGSI